MTMVSLLSLRESQACGKTVTTDSRDRAHPVKPTFKVSSAKNHYLNFAGALPCRPVSTSARPESTAAANRPSHTF